MPALPVTGPTATQNSPFLPQRSPKPTLVLIALTHGGIARLSGLDKCQDVKTNTVTEYNFRHSYRHFFSVNATAAAGIVPVNFTRLQFWVNSARPTKCDQTSL